MARYLNWVKTDLIEKIWEARSKATVYTIYWNTIHEHYAGSYHHLDHPTDSRTIKDRSGREGFSDLHEIKELCEQHADGLPVLG